MIHVGAPSEMEMKEKKARVEDALNATRAAVEEGIVAGGGTALLRSSLLLKEENFSQGERFGAKIVKRACEEPLRQISENAGLDGAIVIDKVTHHDELKGFDAFTEQYVDLIKEGVIDPMKVCRCALENAASVSSLMLTTETMIAEALKKRNQILRCLLWVVAEWVVAECP